MGTDVRAEAEVDDTGFADGGGVVGNVLHAVDDAGVAHGGGDEDDVGRGSHAAVGLGGGVASAAAGGDAGHVGAVGLAGVVGLSGDDG